MLNDNQPGGVDRVGHSSVQAWSAGPLFPAIIAVVEVYEVAMERDEFLRTPGCDLYREYLDAFYAQPLEQRLRYRAFELNYPGRDLMTYGSRDDAEGAAKILKQMDEAARAARRSVEAYDADATEFAQIAARIRTARFAP